MDIKEKIQELIRTVNTYREKFKSGTGDTNVEFGKWNFDVKKEDKQYSVGLEFDLTLTSKLKRDEKSK